MLRGDPEAVHGADLVVDPDERAVAGPLDEMAGLPVQAARALVGGGFRPLHHRQPGQSDPWGDGLVGVIHPGRGPHQLTPQCHQTRSDGLVEPPQQRVPLVGERHGAGGTGLEPPGRRPERDEGSVDVEEKDGPLHRAGHDGTITLRGDG
uniref:Uncharacterized protein n=1 Tax=Streptomyces avermitilis TaxID=33903 RepID=A0A499VTG8_STRAX|nr:hypothetical protein SAVMC3_45880 [Streptomyces avermitilis]